MENLIMENLIKELDNLQAELRGKDITEAENIEKYQRVQELMKKIYGI